MRLLSVVMGAETSDLRSKDTTNLLNYGFNTYKLDLIMSKTKILGNVKVEKGKKDNVDLILKDVIVTQNIDKVNYFDYLKKNLKILTTGF